MAASDGGRRSQGLSASAWTSLLLGAAVLFSMYLTASGFVRCLSGGGRADVAARRARGPRLSTKSQGIGMLGVLDRRRKGRCSVQMNAGGDKKRSGPYKVIANNRKAFRNYEILEKMEAGIELVGSEVKSCRDSRISLDEGFAQAKNGECYLYGVHIAQCSNTNRFDQHEPKRPRRLLLHKSEGIIVKLALQRLPGASHRRVVQLALSGTCFLAVSDPGGHSIYHKMKPKCLLRTTSQDLGPTRIEEMVSPREPVSPREISKIQDKIGQKGLTVVPLKLYFNDKNRLKVEIALAQGKNVRDKRDDIKARDVKRDLNRIVKQAY